MTRTIGIVAVLLVMLIVGGGVTATISVLHMPFPAPAGFAPEGGPPPRAEPPEGVPPAGGPGPGAPRDGRLPPPQQRRMEELATVAIITIVVSGGVLLAAWVLAAALTKRAFATVAETAMALEALAAGDYSKRVLATEGEQQVTRLAVAYNRAAETVARLFDERRSAVRESQRFLADAGHELRTPLTIVAGYIDILRGAEGMDANTYARVIENMHVESNRMRALVEKMLLLARIESTHDRAERIDLNALVSEIVDGLAQRHPLRSISLEGSAGAPITADAGDVNEALTNVIENALKYAPESAVEVRLRDGEDCVEVSVTDYGPGIAKSERGLIFERFFRGEGRGATEGVGLGLAIARSAAQRWNGSLHLLPATDRTVFVLRFPKAAA